VLIVLHLAAVMVAPWSLPPASSFSGEVAGWIRPYLQAMFLNNGYRFFNEPGPGHVVRYTLQMRDGSEQQGMFPDPDQLSVGQSQWPRQFYHRGFMMAEQAVAGVVPPPDRQLIELQPGYRFATPQDEAEYRGQRERYFATLKAAAPVMQSLARALAKENGARTVRLELGERRLPTRDEVQEGIDAGDPQLLQWNPLGTLDRDGVWHWSEQFGVSHNP